MKWLYAIYSSNIQLKMFKGDTSLFIHGLVGLVDWNKLKEGMVFWYYKHEYSD